MNFQDTFAQILFQNEVRLILNSGAFMRFAQNKLVTGKHHDVGTNMQDEPSLKVRVTFDN
jgi:hypothetical protein